MSTDRIRDIQEAAGWTDSTLCGLILGFLADEDNLLKSLESHLTTIKNDEDTWGSIDLCDECGRPFITDSESKTTTHLFENTSDPDYDTDRDHVAYANAE